MGVVHLQRLLTKSDGRLIVAFFLLHTSQTQIGKNILTHFQTGFITGDRIIKTIQVELSITHPAPQCLVARLLL